MRWRIAEIERHLLVGSTLVEGSTLTEKEAQTVLQGRTVAGHSVAEIRELIQYRAAVEWLLKQVAPSPFLSPDLILGFHRILFQGTEGAGKWKTQPNFTFRSDGRRHEYVHPSHMEPAIRTWVVRFNREAKKSLMREAAALYAEFAHIHPFEDGNGRIGRMLTAYWLHWKASLFFSFRAADKIEHLDAMEATNREDLEPLTKFIRTRVRKETS